MCTNVINIAVILKFPVVHKTGAGQTLSVQNGMKILYVKNAGDDTKERIILEVQNDCDIGTYILFDTTYEGEYISDKVRHSFWLPNKKVKAGDKIIIYTKQGEEKHKINNSGNNSYFFYWGLDITVWNKEEDCAVLIKIDDYLVKKVNVQLDLIQITDNVL